jgi:cell division protein FtsI/penicillin-binding protein 2
LDNITETEKEEFERKKIKALGFIKRQKRFYVEDSLFSQTLGFVRSGEYGELTGQYGIEGYFNRELSGIEGVEQGLKSRTGDWIFFEDRLKNEAINGASIVLTLDRNLSFETCEILKKGMLEHRAKSASLIIMESDTGKILTMCGYPDFNPNDYKNVEDINNFNNYNIFTPYEPGSILKPITLAAAIDTGSINRFTTFYDSGEKTGVCGKPIKNALEKKYGQTNMEGVLENSINTGVVYATELLGKKRFYSYLKNFGFGTRYGFEADSEVAGNLDNLTVSKNNVFDCYAATASFGQGITATPLQIVSSFAAIANGGILMRPYVVDEILRDLKVEKSRPREIRRVINKKTSENVTLMMESVILKGQAKNAKIEGYRLAGKTGTAQIAEDGKYIEDTNQSFIGFGPLDNPKYVVLVKLEKTDKRFADATALPVWREIMKFLLNYYNIPKNKEP